MNLPASVRGPWIALMLALAVACDGANTDFHFRLPARVSSPPVPADNPMSAEKVELGRRLFYDSRLSVDGSRACASCHDPKRAFTDGRARPAGLHGGELPRNAPGLANVAYFSAYTWANPRLTTLENQALVPLLATMPEELGLKGHVDQVLARLRADAEYARRFARSFPEDDAPVRLANLVAALAAFERTLLSFDSPYDRYLDGDAAALTPSQTRGKALFESKTLRCAECHRGRLLSDAAVLGSEKPAHDFFHNTGLYNLDGRGLYPLDNQGLYAFTLVAADMGKFRTPSLRNVAETAPYMHDGSIATLDAVLDHYAAGGRTLSEGPNRGVGSQNPYKDPRLQGFALSAAERADLLSFLRSLSDPGFLESAAFQDPFESSAHREQHDQPDAEAQHAQQKP